MRTLKSLTAGLYLAVASIALSAGPAQAIPVLFNITGSGTGTNISGTFELDSAVINGDGGSETVSIFSITDSVLNITWDNTDTVSFFAFADSPVPNTQHISFRVTDLTTGALIFDPQLIPTFPDTGTYGINTAGNQFGGQASISRITEPAAITIFGLGLAALGIARRRRTVPVPG